MGLLAPMWLLLGALAAPLVALYLLKVRRRDRVVPSTLLWRKALRDVEAQVPLRRLRRDWLLALQLAVLALLALAAARPVLQTLLAPGTRAAIVLDASAGMLADRRAAEAVRAARNLAAGRGRGDAIALVRAGAEPEALTPLTGDTGALDAALAGFAPSPAPADIPAALRLARSIVGDDGEVVLITDGSARLEPDGVSDGVRFVHVGRPAGNVGLVSLGVRAANPSGRDHEVFVRLKNASSDPAAGRLVLAVDGRARDATAVTIAPEGTAERTLALRDTRAATLEVRWEAEAPDPHPHDDRAAWVLRPPAERTYRVTGAADPFLAHALRSVPGWRPATDGEAADLEVVLGRAPTVDGPPFLWIDPIELREGTAAGPTVLSWDRLHPQFRFVTLSDLRLGTVSRLKRSPGSRVLADSAAGPLVVEGLRDERRFLAWGFDPLQTDLPVRVAFPLLVQNALEYLAPADGSLPGGLASGTAPEVPWSGTGAVVLRDPDGRSFDLRIASGRLDLPSLDRVGVWQLEGEGRRVAFGVNLLDERETDLRPASPPPVGGRAARASASEARSVSRRLWPPLAFLALVLLVLEAWAFERRWSP